MTTKELINEMLFTINVNSESCFDRFIEIAPRFYGKNYWYALGLAYTSSDNLYHYRDYVKDAFASKKKDRNALMTDEELQIWEELPEKITIYRGMTLEEKRSGVFGVSWTLSQDIAEFYAEVYTRNTSTNHLPKTVHQLTVEKKHIIAYFNERNEQEVIYFNLDNEPQRKRKKYQIMTIEETIYAIDRGEF